jgi:prolyl oligopeptidase
MKLRILLIAIVMTSMTFNSIAQTRISYPDTRKMDTADSYFGKSVADPYRWLEDDNSDETKAWVTAQNKVTFGYLNQIPERPQLRNRLTELWNYERYGAPFKRGGKYFYFKNDGLQNQSVLYVTTNLRETGQVLLDPNKLAADGTTALSGLSVSEDGKTLAYGIAVAGSDWQEWRFIDIATGAPLPDVLKHIKFSGVSWMADGSGVFYSRYPEADSRGRLSAQNLFQKLYFHKMGTVQSEDKLIYDRPEDGQKFVRADVTDDGKWLVINVGRGTAPMNMVYLKDLSDSNSEIFPVIDELVADYTYITNVGNIFYFRTDRNAPLGKVVSVNVKTSKKIWKDVIAQKKETLEGASMLDGKLVANYLKDAYTQVNIHDRNGRFIRNIQLPGIGTASGFGGRPEDKETFYTFATFNSPPVIYRYNMTTGKSSVFRKPEVRFDPNSFETKQVFYTSKDGTRVPMFIVHKKGVKLDGTNPTLLYGYGGFSVSMTPSFSVSRIVWMENGGVYAMPNIRGGAEYGEEWHEAGTKLKKQNVFDDFIAAAEYLIDNKYTQPSKLAISGGSNGGLLVGAALNQRPELFGAALPAVGVMDMLRFHKFTIGRAWVSDYGSSEDSVEFEALYAYSPLHNIRRGIKYPAVLVTTADHDDRVVPAHSFKYAATLQAAQTGEAPVLIRIETNAGHGAGKPTSKQIEEATDVYGFLMKNLGMRLK